MPLEYSTWEGETNTVRLVECPACGDDLRDASVPIHVVTCGALNRACGTTPGTVSYNRDNAAFRIDPEDRTCPWPGCSGDVLAPAHSHGDAGCEWCGRRPELAP